MVKPKRYPFAVQIHLHNNRGSATCVCGGSILADSWVLTAAHCVWDINARANRNVSVVAGDVSTKVFKEGEAGYNTLDNKHEGRKEAWPHLTLKHENYTNDQANYDIALLYFRNPLFTGKNGHIAPIGLPKLQNYKIPAANTGCTVMGWGTTKIEEGTNKPVELSTFLKYAYLRVSSKSTELHILFKMKKDVLYMLNGDSGGPLICIESGNSYKLFGVAKAMVDIGKDVYVKYTRVEFFKRWISARIMDVIAKEKEQEKK